MKNSHSPVRVASDMFAVAAGNSSSYALTNDGILWAWGLSAALIEQQALHPSVSSMSNRTYSYITAARGGAIGNEGYAITDDGALWMWRVNTDGVVPFFFWEPEMLIGSGVVLVCVRENAVFILDSDNILVAWGDNSNGQLGDGTTQSHNNSVRIAENISTVALGVNHALAIDTDGRLWSWGGNHQGQLGNGTTEGVLVPTLVLFDELN